LSLKEGLFSLLIIPILYPTAKVPWENQVYFVFLFISCISKLTLAPLVGLYIYRWQHLFSSLAACTPRLLRDLIIGLQPTGTLNKAKRFQISRPLHISSCDQWADSILNTSEKAIREQQAQQICPMLRSG